MVKGFCSVTLTHREMIMCFQAWWVCLAVGRALQMWCLEPHCFRSECGETAQGHFIGGFRYDGAKPCRREISIVLSNKRSVLSHVHSASISPIIFSGSRRPVQTRTSQSPMERDLEPADFSKRFTRWNVTGPKNNFAYHLRSALCTSAVFYFHAKMHNVCYFILVLAPFTGSFWLAALCQTSRKSGIHLVLYLKRFYKIAPQYRLETKTVNKSNNRKWLEPRIVLFSLNSAWNFFYFRQFCFYCVCAHTFRAVCVCGGGALFFWCPFPVSQLEHPACASPTCAVGTDPAASSQVSYFPVFLSPFFIAFTSSAK